MCLVQRTAFNYFRVLSPSNVSFVYIFCNRLGDREVFFTRDTGISQLGKEKKRHSTIVPTVSYWEELMPDPRLREKGKRR